MSELKKTKRKTECVAEAECEEIYAKKGNLEDIFGKVSKFWQVKKVQHKLPLCLTE